MWLTFRQGGIFNSSWPEIIKKHSGLKFFKKWLDAIDQICDPNALSVKQLKEYLALKVNVNMNPDMEIPAGSETFIYCLVRDFLEKLKGSIIPRRTATILQEFCKQN